MNEQVNEAMNEQMQNWVAGQIRSAILLGLSLYTKRTAAEKAGGAVGGSGSRVVALECAAYAEAAIWRLKSVQENGLSGGQGTARPTTPDSETEVGGGVPSAPQNKKVNLVACIEGFLAAEHAAGRVAAIGYWSADGKWVSKTAAQFIADLKAAYAQRAALRCGR